MYDFMAFLGPNELAVIERCPYYRGVRKESLDCIKMLLNNLRSGSVFFSLCK